MYLTKLFEWPVVPRRNLNRSIPGSHRQLIEDGLEKVLKGLLEEDSQLYRYISQECDGLFTNFSENFSLPQSFDRLMLI